MMKMKRRRARKARWSLEDLVDLEVALEADAELGLNAVEARDPQWAARIRQRTPGGSDRSTRIRHWLQFRREAARAEETAGSSVERTGALLGKVLAVSGLVVGIVTTVSVLRYEGESPVNVSGFLFVLILLQMLWALISIFGLFRMGRSRRSVLGSMVKSVWAGVLRKAGQLHESLTASTQSESAVRGLQLLWRYHPGMVQFRIARMAQGFGIAFNIGAIGAMFLVLLIADRAFGWQSTLIQSPEVFHRLTEAVAAPWKSWIPSAAPSLEAVAGSRILLKEGARALATPDLVAWWPFLLTAVIAYGLVPRVGLWLGFVLLERRMLRQKAFEGLRYEDLDDRLNGTVDERGADPQEVETWLNSPQGMTEDGTPGHRGTPGAESDSSLYVLLKTDGPLGISSERMVRAIEENTGGRVDAICEIGELELSGSHAEHRIAMVVESWTAPVEEDLFRISSLRERLGPSRSLRVFLLPIPGEALPEERWVEMWTRFYARLRDQNLSVRSLPMNPEVVS